jgi:hypothetical protein
MRMEDGGASCYPLSGRPSVRTYLTPTYPLTTAERMGGGDFRDTTFPPPNLGLLVHSMQRRHSAGDAMLILLSLNVGT